MPGPARIAPAWRVATAQNLTAVLLSHSYSMPGLSYNSILGKFMVFTTDAEVSACMRSLHCGVSILYRQPTAHGIRPVKVVSTDHPACSA